MLAETDEDILDVGCGEGITTKRATRTFPDARVRGLDYMERNVEICLQHGLCVDLGDVYEIPASNESFDAVIFMEVLEHLDRPEGALAEIRRVLRPNGRLILVFPNDCFFKFARLLLLKLDEARYDSGHVRQRTPRSARKALEAQGFGVFHSRAVPFFIWPISLHAVLGARKLER